VSSVKNRIPLGRVVVEGIVIVGSILLAFGIDAGWDARQERARRGELMADLEAEVALNVERLADALARQRLRLERVDLLLREITPDAVGLQPDSLRALQAGVLTNPSYDPAWGILDLLIQSGDLALLDDRELRARLAGLQALSNDYLGNQDWLLDRVGHPDVLYGTGSIVMDYSAVIPGDLTITTAGPEARDAAAKFLTVVRLVTNQLLIGQGEALLDEFEGILALLRRASSPS
jgi:hypothetical protein